MKDITIRFVTTEASDSDLWRRADAFLGAKGYRNIIIEQVRRFGANADRRVSVYAVADHDLKRPPGILGTMKAPVLTDINNPNDRASDRAATSGETVPERS